MSRLQKKCFVGATSLHGLLLLTLLVGPGFFSKDEPLDLAVIEFVPSMLTDEKKSGGGNPTPANNPPPAPAPPTPTVVPPQVEPEKLAEKKPQPEKVEPEKVEPVKKPRPDPDAPVAIKDPPKKHQVTVSDKKVKIASATNRRPPTSRETATSANTAFTKAIKSAGQRIGSSLSSSTQINMPDGPGGGGPSYANYAQEVQRIYKRAYDQALLAAGDIAEERTTVETSVVILRDGTVTTTSVVKSSGNAALDSLTRRVLDSIRQVPPFPAGAKDSRRTFNIIFDLKPKINLG